MLRTSIALALSTFALGVACAAPAQVATLGKVEGTVMLNQGERYVAASAGAPLAPGDRVMVMADSKAEIGFSADGCALELGANVVTSVPAQSTCAGGVADIRKFGPSYAQAVGSTVTSPPAAPTAGADEDDDDDDHRAAWLWFGGGVLAAAIIYDQTRDHDRERTASR